MMLLLVELNHLTYLFLQLWTFSGKYAGEFYPFLWFLDDVFLPDLWFYVGLLSLPEIACSSWQMQFFFPVHDIIIDKYVWLDFLQLFKDLGVVFQLALYVLPNWDMCKGFFFPEI